MKEALLEGPGSDSVLERGGGFPPSAFAIVILGLEGGGGGGLPTSAFAIIILGLEGGGGGLPSSTIVDPAIIILGLFEGGEAGPGRLSVDIALSRGRNDCLLHSSPVCFYRPVAGTRERERIGRRDVT